MGGQRAKSVSVGEKTDGANMQSRKVMFIIDDKVVPVDQQMSLDKLDDS